MESWDGSYDRIEADVESNACPVTPTEPRTSVGLYTAEPMQADGMLVRALPENADPKLKKMLQYVERDIRGRLNINVKDLEKVEISDKALGKALAWAAYKTFDLDVTPAHFKKAILPAKVKAIAVTAAGTAMTVMASCIAGLPIWTGFVIGGIGQIVASKLVSRTIDKAETDLPTVERAIKLKLAEKEDRYRL